MGSLAPRVIVDDFDKPRRETVVQFLRSGAVLRKQVSGELDPLSPSMDLRLGLDAAGSSSGTNAL